MRQYFSQFGDISRLRLSRNRRTGQSKHFAFIEFTTADIAEIVAKTMDNYLMFGHILKCKLVPSEQLHENVWKGANKRFKTVPWNKLERRKHEMAVGRDQWSSRIEKEEKRREAKKEKLKEIDYEFEVPPIKSVDRVPVKDIPDNLENGDSYQEEQQRVPVNEIADNLENGDPYQEEEQSLVTARKSKDPSIAVISEEVKIKKTQKRAKDELEKSAIAAARKMKRKLEPSEGAAKSKAMKVKKSRGTAV